MAHALAHFAEVVIPASAATDLALETDARTGLDTAYAIKSALNEAFGVGTVRPWRLVASSSGLLRVLGCIPGADALASTVAARRLGLSFHVFPFPMSDGDRFRVEVEATPVKNVRHRDPATRRIVADQRLDITAVRAEGEGPLRYVCASGEELEAAYSAWLIEQVGAEGRGARVVSSPEILDSTPAFRTRKLRERTGQVGISRVRGRVEVEVSDPAAFAGVMRHGLKRMKDVGLGSIIPSAVLAEVVT